MKLTKIKVKDTLFKATREKRQIICKGADFSTETLQAKREWHDIFQVIKWKNLWLSLRFDGEIKRFPDKQKLREFSTTKPALQQVLKEIL